MTDQVISTLDQGVRTIAINRPEVRNAISFETTAALSAAVVHAIEDRQTRCVVLTGRGGAFSSGADLKAMMSGAVGPGSVDDRIAELHAVVKSIRQAPLPFIASVDGPAAGFGCDLALACDMRIVSTRAYFAELFVRIGLIPDGGGTFLLPRLVGLARAFELMATGDRVSGEEAVRIGLANRVVEPDALESATLELARRIAKGPPLALHLMKECLERNLSADYSSALDNERRAQLRCLASPDLIEGVSAFFEKRDPRFSGERD
ncbi:MAG: enoyl-CoA hydratase [Deltaproteobacteria bacterium]|nr:enoyl-CoA hydratase [Deltaproteobacteria bacterium]